MEGAESLLILLFSLIVLGARNPECGSEPCKDLFTAKKCDKMKFCIAENWSKLAPTGNRDNVCDICLRMVKEARDTLQSNETREQLLQVFEGSCRLLVLKPAVEVCDKIVDEFVPELVEILSSEMDPETVCSVAKLCNNDMFRTAQKESKECISCEKITKCAAKKMETISSEEFRNKILNRCRDAGTFSDACAHFGLEYSSALYNYSKIILNRKPCEAISLCPSGLVDSQAEEDASKCESTEEEMCPLSYDVMTNVREQLLRVKSAEEFGEKMMSVCGRMGFSESACSKISKSLFDKLKRSNTLPRVLSEVACRGAESEDKDVPFWPLVPAHNGSFGSYKEFDLLEVLENVQMFFPVVMEEKTEIRKEISFGDPIANPIFFTPSVNVAEFGNCKTCAHVLEALSKSAKTDVRNADKILNNVCDKAEDVEMCRRFIDNFLPVLTKEFTENMESPLVCEDLIPLCKVERRDSSSEVTQDDTCQLCLNTARIFKYGNSESLNQVINEMCGTLPGSSKEKCVLSLTRFPSVLKNYTEDEICNSLKYCLPSSAILPNTSHTHIEATDYCSTCVNTLQKLSDMMKDPNTDLIIRGIFDSLCTLLPYYEYSFCRKVVDVMGVEGLRKLIANIKPKKICREIYLCREKEESNFTTLPDLPSKNTSTETKGKVPCKFCLMAIRTLLDQLQDDKTEESIRKALDGLCNYLPEETRDTCRTLIDEYTEDIIDMIIADFNPNEICTYLKICPARHLLGDAHEKDLPVFDIRTNEVRDENSWKTLLDSFTQKRASVTVGKKLPREQDLERFHKVVQECALCEALVGVISSHKKMLDKNYDFSANAQYICSIVPPKEREKCMSMIVSYGPSIVNLILDQKVDKNEVCVRVDLCDPKMQAKVNLPVSVPEEKFVPNHDNDCMLGPVFWCANAENAEKCKTFLHCQETVWKNWKNPPKKPTRI